MSTELGSLQLVDIRSLWPNEAADFTPWLARPENLAGLGAAIGIELEIEHSEVGVGPYSADIVARDSATGSYVVIENQLERTDHDHLGKAITYAAALDAGTVVWIAPEFTDEHRKAIDWLNDNSSEDLSFYAVQLELWQIDASRPAVRFNVVGRPRELLRHVSLSGTDGPISESRQLQLEWWTMVRDALVERHVVPTARSPRPRYWYSLALGRTGLHISNIASVFDKRIGVRIYLRSKHGGAAALAQLREAKDDIEKEIGHALLWDANPDARDKIIAIYRDADLTRRDKWPEYCAWMIEMIGSFYKTFSPRVRELDLNAPEEDEEADS